MARQGQWKLVARMETGNQWEPYDMEADRTETNNLAVERPDLVERMSRPWQQWAERCNVLRPPAP